MRISQSVHGSCIFKLDEPMVAVANFKMDADITPFRDNEISSFGNSAQQSGDQLRHLLLASDLIMMAVY